MRSLKMPSSGPQPQFIHVDVVEPETVPAVPQIPTKAASTGSQLIDSWPAKNKSSLMGKGVFLLARSAGQTHERDSKTYNSLSPSLSPSLGLKCCRVFSNVGNWECDSNLSQVVETDVESAPLPTLKLYFYISDRGTTYCSSLLCLRRKIYLVLN